MRHRYPFEALHWLRQQRVDRQATLLGESAQRAARARSEAERAAATRRGAEQTLAQVSSAEQALLDEGLVRAFDLQAVADWRKGAAAELAAKADRERLAREVQGAEDAAEAAARRALAAASSEAKTIDVHRDAFRAERAAAEERSEEDAVAEQWAASHFPARRS